MAKKAKRKPKSFRLTKRDRELLEEQLAVERYYEKQTKKRKRKQKQKTSGKQRKERFEIVKEVAAEETLSDVKREVEKAESGRYRTVQKGFVLLEKRGYSIVLRVLVPFDFTQYAPPVVDPGLEGDALHLVIWRTKVKATVLEAIEDYDQLIVDQTVLSETQDVTFMVLSAELTRINEDLSFDLLETWSGPKIPRRLRTWSKKQSKR